MVRRLPLSSRVFALLSVTCAAAAFVAVRGLEMRLAAQHPSLGTPMPVLVAARPATRGEVVQESMIKVESMPSVYAPPGSLSAVGQALGRTLIADVAPGEVITNTRLSSGASGPVASIVPPGLRAVAVTVQVSALDLHAGDRVDVIAAFGGASAHVESVGTALEVLKIEEAGGSDGPLVVGADGSGKIVLLLLVSPTDAERIAFAQAFASLSVAIEPAPGSVASGRGAG
jgi:pilus assembly protein CpaB